MAITEYNPPIGEAYRERLAAIYGEEAAFEVTEGLRLADLSHQPEDAIGYARVSARGDESRGTILIVHGFSEGMAAKAPFALELATHGYDVILPDQHRGPVRVDDSGRRSAKHTQALDMFAILKAKDLLESDEPLHVATHSYGALVYEAMLKIAKLRGLPVFDGSKATLLAPSGTNDRENLISLGLRFARHMHAESKTQKDFPDKEGEMFKAGTRNLTANIPRSTLE